MDNPVLAERIKKLEERMDDLGSLGAAAIVQSGIEILMQRSTLAVHVMTCEQCAEDGVHYCHIGRGAKCPCLPCRGK